MNPFFTKAKLFFKRIITALILIATALVILWLFPHHGKFPYEYQMGGFWMNKTLIAPYDFPLYKSQIEIDHERDSLLLNHPVYLNKNSEIKTTMVDDFRSQWSDNWSAIVNHAGQTGRLLPIDPTWSDSYFRYALFELDSLYGVGILSPEILETYPNLRDRVTMVVDGTLATRRLPGESLTSLNAYQLLKEQMTDAVRFGLLNRENLEWIFQEHDFSRYIEPNLTLDVAKTDEVRKNEMDHLSLARDLVHRGQRVISEGDVVNEDRYQMLESYRQAYELERGDSSLRWAILGGQVMLIVLCLAGLVLYLYNYRLEIIQDTIKFAFIFFILTLALLGGGLAARSNVISIYLVPLVILPVIIRNFYDSRTALFIHLIGMMIMGFLVPNGFEFILMQILTGFAAIISFQHLHRRGQLVVTSGVVFATYSLLYITFSLIHNGQFSSIKWLDIAWLAGNCLLLLLSYPLIFIFEKLFGFVSDVTLIELSDSNHPLLRKLAEEAPGTFQHSIQVANLAETVVREIGGNPLLVRTGAMYHDIGKSESPFYFTENQASGQNPHIDMQNTESARVIINHVQRGAEIARKHRLPKPIIDFIRTHHGTSRTQYFLKMEQRKNPGVEVDEKPFAYPGPRPYTKETAVLMMADSIEAASRSLPEYSVETITDLVNRIIDHQFEEGQFEESEITFRDLYRTREIMIKKLVNIYHARIDYPK